MFDKVPPQNLEAERAVLGAMIVENDLIPKVIQTIVSSNEFYREDHRHIFDAIVKLYRANGRVDVISLKDQMRHEDPSVEASYLAQLVDSVITAKDVDSHIKIIRDKHWRRGLMRFISGRDLEEESPTMLEMRFKNWFGEHRLVSSDDWSIREAVGRTLERIEKRAKQGMEIASGFMDLDRKFGGFEPAKVYVLGARPSMGKTSFEINMSIKLAKEGKKPLIIAAEGSDTDYIMRMLSLVEKIDSQKVRMGFLSDEEWGKLTEAAAVIAELPIVIRDFSSPKLPQIVESVWRYDPDILFIDYLQLMNLEGVPGDGPNYQYGWIIKRFKDLAKDEKIPVVVLSQLSRRVEERQSHRPKLADLRDSGEIEQDVDVVMLLHWPWRYESSEDKNKMEMLVVKARDGEIGPVRFYWEPQFYAFHSYMEGEGLEEEERSV